MAASSTLKLGGRNRATVCYEFDCRQNITSTRRKMENPSTVSPSWRLPLLKRLDIVLIVFELVLSVIFIAISYVTGNVYFRGVGIGLVIAWVTSAIAYFFKHRMVQP